MSHRGTDNVKVLCSIQTVLIKHCWTSQATSVSLDPQPVGLESWTRFRGLMVVMVLDIFSSLCVILIDGHRMALYIELNSWGIFGLFNNAIFRMPSTR